MLAPRGDSTVKKANYRYGYREIVRVLAFLAVIAVAVPLYSASFDCNLASTDVEKLICADSTLSGLDEKMASAYEAALNTTQDRNALLVEHREWISFVLNKCEDATCLKKVYAQRIGKLWTQAQKSGSQEATGSVSQSAPPKTTSRRVADREDSRRGSGGGEKDAGQGASPKNGSKPNFALIGGSVFLVAWLISMLGTLISILTRRSAKIKEFFIISFGTLTGLLVSAAMLFSSPNSSWTMMSHSDQLAVYTVIALSVGSVLLSFVVPKIMSR